MFAGVHGCGEQKRLGNLCCVWCQFDILFFPSSSKDLEWLLVYAGHRQCKVPSVSNTVILCSFLCRIRCNGRGLS